MFLKPLFRTAAAALVLAVCAIVAPAQVVTGSGKVVLKQADGTMVPIKDAVVDIYRTDIKGEFHLKTNAKGEWTHAGLPLVGTYTVTVSAPGARPSFDKGIRFSQRPQVNFALEPGDGARLTLEQIKNYAATAKTSAAAAGGGTDKKANSLPAAEKTPLMATALKDFIEAADAATKAVAVIKDSTTAADDPNKGVLNQNRMAALGERAENLRLIVLLSDKSKAAEAVAAYQEYIPTLIDPAAQAKARLNSAEMLFEVGAFRANNSKGSDDFPAAIENFKQSQVEYQKVLEVDPNNTSALAKIGLAYIQIGYLSNPPDDKMLQEGANYLQKFADKAPDTDPLKSDAIAQIQALKSMNIVPKKVETPSRPAGRRRGQ
ncbi:MAG: carboxypeptidase-like regulatory domain-containing protein [Acidobacteria bacterium]|nr:carboxypeptidase-like regulatory domain-containing protein [Acidobacteriota bacterium]